MFPNELLYLLSHRDMNQRWRASNQFYNKLRAIELETNLKDGPSTQEETTQKYTEN